MSNTVKLLLEDGTKINGELFGAASSKAGEVVFNTSMVGYPESLTDPSYKGQILVLTYPIVGNYGVPGDEDLNKLKAYLESDKIQVQGLIVSYYSDENSHWNAKRSLSEWLQQYNIPGIHGVDTRALTKKLRENGTMLGKIVVDNKDLDYYNPNEDNLVAQVSTPKVETYGEGDTHIILVDCGVKNSIIRCLVDRGVKVTRVPWDHDFTKEDFDGLFISNGPGDPKQCQVTVDRIKKVMDEFKPIFGICLGNQLVGLAAGADTYKLKYSHRSHNQPVLQNGTKKCFITSQNHGYALDSQKLPQDWEE